MLSFADAAKMRCRPFCALRNAVQQLIGLCCGCSWVIDAVWLLSWLQLLDAANCAST